MQLGVYSFLQQQFVHTGQHTIDVVVSCLIIQLSVRLDKYFCVSFLFLLLYVCV